MDTDRTSRVLSNEKLAVSDTERESLRREAESERALGEMAIVLQGDPDAEALPGWMRDGEWVAAVPGLGSVAQFSPTLRQLEEALALPQVREVRPAGRLRPVEPVEFAGDAPERAPETGPCDAGRDQEEEEPENGEAS